MTTAAPSVDQQLAIDTIRALAIDGVQQANSGHPGTPMGAAPMTYVLWTRFLRHAPTRPDWFDRDRFVLSAGHASMLLYSMLHLTGYDLPLDELKRFRQLGSRTPGHPEYGLTPGVEATTGPLGQGFTNAVGMAMAERRLAAEFDRPGHDIIDHRTWVICSDGDLQEGISGEAASLAGHLRLGRLVVLYDDNDVQLDGPTSMAWSEDVPARFEAYGWHTQRVPDGNDVEAIAAALEAARADDRPSLIAVRTVIGYGSPHKAGSHKAHGAPLGVDEVRLTKQAYGLDPDRSFDIAPAVLEHLRAAVDEGEALVEAWEARLTAYGQAYPEEAAELRRRIAGRLPQAWDADLPSYARRRRRPGHPQRLEERAPGPQGPPARALRRLGRPVRVQSHRSRRRRRLQRHRGWSQHPLRGPRACHGRHRQRHRLPRRAPALRGHVPELQRLHAWLGAPGGPLGTARRLRVDP